MDTNKDTLLKNSCWAAIGHSCAHYLLATYRCDGALKAHKHEELCNHYVAVVMGCDPDDARRHRAGGSTIVWNRIHEHTANLTSYLDQEIGFKVDEQPDLDVLSSAFFDKFHKLAMEAALSATTPKGSQ